MHVCVCMWERNHTVENFLYTRGLLYISMTTYDCLGGTHTISLTTRHASLFVIPYRPQVPHLFVNVSRMKQLLPQVGVVVRSMKQQGMEGFASIGKKVWTWVPSNPVLDILPETVH